MEPPILGQRINTKSYPKNNTRCFYNIRSNITDQNRSLLFEVNASHSSTFEEITELILKKESTGTRVYDLPPLQSNPVFT